MGCSLRARRTSLLVGSKSVRVLPSLRTLIMQSMLGVFLKIGVKTSTKGSDNFCHMAMLGQKKRPNVDHRFCGVFLFTKRFF